MCVQGKVKWEGGGYLLSSEWSNFASYLKNVQLEGGRHAKRLS